MALRQTHHWDTALELRDAGQAASTSSEAGEVGGGAQILDLGAHDYRGAMHVSVSAVDAASSTEVYKISLQGSTSATFASGIRELVAMELGNAEAIDGDADVLAGEYYLGFANVHDGITYQYVRTFVNVAGSTPSIDYTARLVKNL